jgi:hypothetical protein
VVAEGGGDVSMVALTVPAGDAVVAVPAPEDEQAARSTAARVTPKTPRDLKILMLASSRPAPRRVYVEVSRDARAGGRRDIGISGRP